MSAAENFIDRVQAWRGENRFFLFFVIIIQARRKKANLGVPEAPLKPQKPKSQPGLSGQYSPDNTTNMQVARF